MSSFGATVFVPTSTPTTKKIPRKSSRIVLSPSREKAAPIEELFFSGASSGMRTDISHKADNSVMAAKIGKRYCQLPRTPAANDAMKGPQNDDTAFTTCPTVSELVSASPLTTFVSRGFSDTCRIVLPMPSSTKATMQVTRL